MNTEDFVTYEQALALKKLGFNEYCLCYYEANVLMLFNQDSILYNIENNKIGIGGSFNRFRSVNKDVCDAPTLTQAQKWLRKNRGYSIEPISVFRYGFNLYIFDFNTERRLETPDYVYNSYEEALSAGITKCIELLEKED